MRRLRRLLEALLPGDDRGVGRAALDDLDRELAGRRRDRPGRSHLGWYAVEGFRLLVHLHLGRLLDALRRRRDATSNSDRSFANPMDRLSRNLRYALRRMRHNPGFALAAVLTLAMGVGANVAVFSVVDAVLLEPFPYEDPDELTVLWEWNRPRDRRTNLANPGNIRAWRERSETLEDIAAIRFVRPQLLGGEGERRELVVRLVTPNFFDVLGMEAALGRTFSAGTELGDEFLLTDGYWQQEYGADPGVVGRSLTFASGGVGTIVGVLPPDYVIWGESAQVYAAFPLRGDQTSSGRFLTTVARLRDGVTLERAREELEAIAAGLREEHPGFNAGYGVNIVPLEEHVVGETDAILWLLLGAVGLLLLIACANVSNLFLARATARRREMAVRSSLGASRGTLVGQLLVESALVAGVGAVVGVAVAHAATRAAATRLPAAFGLPRVEGAGVDGAVLLFAVGVTVLTALLFGLVPALEASGTEPGEALSSEARGPGRNSGRARSALVVTEVALSILLLVGAGLVVRSLDTLLSEELGIEPENVLTARVSLSAAGYREPEARARFLETYADRVATLPGVEAAGMIPFLPLAGGGSDDTYYPGDGPVPARGEDSVVDVRNVAGAYFDAMGIRLLRGRAFDERDEADAPPVAVVSRALAEEAWPGRDPLGRSVVLTWGDPHHVATVIGVVEDVRLTAVEAEPRAAVYYPVAQFPEWGAFHVVVRSTRRLEDLRDALTQALHEIDPSLALSDVHAMETIVKNATARPRMTALLMAAFAAVAAALAAVGLYGVLSYAVSRRTREIGLRIALGARPLEVLARIVRQGMALVAIGLAIGLGAALLVSRFLEGLLYEMEPTDPVAVATAAVFLAAVALVACSVPAWRATRVDPSEALRAD